MTAADSAAPVDIAELKRLARGATASGSWTVKEAAMNKLANALPSLIAMAEENAELRKRNLDAAMLAYKWMVAHDMLKAGEPYQCPAPVDLPASEARADRLAAQLAHAETRIAVLVEALEPFADLAAQWDDMRSGTPSAPDHTPIGNGTFTLGQCRVAERVRRAAKALASANGEKGVDRG